MWIYNFKDDILVALCYKNFGLLVLSLQGSPVGEEVHEKLAQSEHLMKEMSRTWEEKLVETGMLSSL